MEIGYWGSALPGFELGFLRLDSAALTTRLQIHCSSSYSPIPQIKYPTHEAHPADILISPSLVTAADTIHLIFSTHALFFLSQATGLIHTKLDQPHVLISFIHWVDRTVKLVSNGSAVAHKSGLVRSSPHTPGF